MHKHSYFKVENNVAIVAESKPGPTAFIGTLDAVRRAIMLRLIGGTARISGLDFCEDILAKATDGLDCGIHGASVMCPTEMGVVRFVDMLVFVSQKNGFVVFMVLFHKDSVDKIISSSGVSKPYSCSLPQLLHGTIPANTFSKENKAGEAFLTAVRKESSLSTYHIPVQLGRHARMLFSQDGKTVAIKQEHHLWVDTPAGWLKCDSAQHTIEDAIRKNDFRKMFVSLTESLPDSIDSKVASWEWSWQNPAVIGLFNEALHSGLNNRKLA